MSYAELWNLCFGDSLEFAEDYIKNVIDRSYGIFENGNAVSMAHVIFKNAIIKGEKVRSAFVVGVATHPDYRNRGLQRQIFEKLEADIDTGLIQLATYIPEFYEKLGFERAGQLVGCVAEPKKTGLTVRPANEADMRRCYEKYMQGKSGYFEKAEFSKLREADDAVCIYGEDILGYCIFSEGKALEAAFLSEKAACAAAEHLGHSLEFLAPEEIASDLGFCVQKNASAHMVKPAQNVRFCNIDEY